MADMKQLSNMSIYSLFRILRRSGAMAYSITSDEENAGRSP